jgi:hypothetical protein
MKRELLEPKDTRTVRKTPSPIDSQQQVAAIPAVQRILQLQRTIGNRAVQRLIQTKLQVSQPDDVYEREADRVAEYVMQMPEPQAQHNTASSGKTHGTPLQRLHTTPDERVHRQSEAEENEEEQKEEPIQANFLDGAHLQRQVAEEEEEAPVQAQVSGDSESQRQTEEPEEDEEEIPVQTRQEEGHTPQIVSTLEARLHAAHGYGQPLSESDRSFFEARFGYDFSQVNLHTDAAADSLNRDLHARAFTTGHDIYFRQGEYHPNSSTGRTLLAHELTHVVQQTGGRAQRKATVQRTCASCAASGSLCSKCQAETQETLQTTLLANQITPLVQRQMVPQEEQEELVQAKLLAPELAHVVQHGGSVSNALIQRQGDKQKKGVAYYRYQVLVPDNYTTLEQMYKLFERTVYGREMNFTWHCNNYCDMSKNQGKIVPFSIPQSDVESYTDPDVKKQREQHKQGYGQLPSQKKAEISEEVNRRYFNLSGDKPGTKIKQGETGKARMWEQQLDEVMKEKEILERLPPEFKQLMGAEGAFKPKDYTQLLRIAEKLKQFGPEDFAVYKLLAIKATDNLALFEKSVDMYLARKEELKKALEEEQKKTPSTGAKDPTMQDAIAEQWKGLDESAIGKMSEDERYQLARQKTSEVTEAQLKYMKEHPGETLKDFAKAATLMNTGETFSAIGKDLTEVANGDANTWARWAAGVGAGAKLSGWLLAVAGILYVASWLTGIGELATIAAAAGILLGSTLTLSAVESELRIKAASQAKTPEEFKRNVELAAAARANVIVGVALIVVAAVLHFTAKALFPKTIENIKVSLKNFRERVRLKGSVYELKPQIVQEMGARKAELVKATELAKQKAVDGATELEGLSTEQFVDKLEKGDSGGFLDQSKLPPEQKVNFRELLKTPEGRAAIEAYKQKLVTALKTDVVAEIDRLAKEYTSNVDKFLKDIDAAKNHDDLRAATDQLESVLSEEHAKTFMTQEQEAITKQKLEEATAEAHKEVLSAIRDAIVKRVKSRIAAQSDKFQLIYSEAELEAIIKRAKELGLSDRVIEDLLYAGSRTAKAISATDLMQQMENWANVISPRGYPYRFADLAAFQQFSKDLLEGVRKAGLPTDDVRVQGSSLRKTSANDVDLAVFVDEATFDKLLIDRYHERIVIKENGTKVSLRGKSHTELLQLANDIGANPGKYNAQGGTFQNAMKNSIISSKSDIVKPLKDVAATIAGKYPHLNIEAISVLIKGGRFDLKPDLPVKSN